MSDYKVIVAGPKSAGKHTAIMTVSDGRKRAADGAGMDMGAMRLDNGANIQLYYATGKERIDYMWEMLSNNCLGLIFLLDNSRKDPIKDLHEFCHTYADFISSSAIAVGVTKMDINDKPVLDYYHRSLNKVFIKAPVFEVDARRREDISALVNALYYSSSARSAARLASTRQNPALFDQKTSACESFSQGGASS